MTDEAAQAIRAMTMLTSALIELGARLASAATERWAQRLRAAAIAGEHTARIERARLATQHALDTSIWRRTTDPTWWQTATPDRISRAWQAVNTWYHIDDEAAGARNAMATRLREAGYGVSHRQPHKTGSESFLHDQFGRAMTEAAGGASVQRDARAARAAELDGDAPYVAVSRPKRPGRPPSQADQESPGRSSAPLPEQLQDTHAGAASHATESGPIASGAGDSPTPAGVGPGVGIPRTDNWPFDAWQRRQPPMRTTTTAADRDRMEAILRQAWPPSEAAAVLADPAWPVLANAMHQLHTQQPTTNLHDLLANVASTYPLDGHLPAVHAASALHTAAQGPAALRSAAEKALRKREHQRRTNPQAQHPIASSQDGQAETPGTPHTRAADRENTRLLNIAFPTTTKQALNAALNSARPQEPPVPEPRIRSTHRARAGQAGIDKT